MLFIYVIIILENNQRIIKLLNKNNEFALAVANLAAAAINANPKLTMQEAVKQATESLQSVSVSKQQIADSVTDDAIQCLEDGTWHVMLRRYIKRKFNMTPQQYREKWGLPMDYPFVAKKYAMKRSKIAKKTGFGKK